MQRDQNLVNKLKVPNPQVRWFTLSSKKEEEEANKKNKGRAKGQDNRKQRSPGGKDEKRRQRASKSDVGDKNALKAKRRQEVKAVKRPSRRDVPDSKESHKKTRFKFDKENTVVTSRSKSSPMKLESSDNVLKRRMRTQVWHWSKASVKQNTHLMKLLADNRINIDDINVSRLHLNDLDIETIGVKNRVLRKALLWLFR